MKRGFTLAELLITLGIIGVISALLGAAITKLKPDGDKATFLKQYDAVMSVTDKVVRDSRLYPICQNMEGENNWNCRQHPLFNIAETNVGGKSISGAGKYCDILATMLGGKKLSDNSCTLNPTYADGSWTPTFTTKNGAEWLVSTTRSSSGSANSGYRATYQTEIYFDINGAKAPNCLYVKNKCETPDRFKLLVAADGTILAADPMGQAYINTRKNWNKKELEIEDSAAVVANLDNNLRTFTLNTCGNGAEYQHTDESSGGGSSGGESDESTTSPFGTNPIYCILTVQIVDHDNIGYFGLFCSDIQDQMRYNNSTRSVKYKLFYNSGGDSYCFGVGSCSIDGDSKSRNELDGIHFANILGTYIGPIYLDSDDASSIVIDDPKIVFINATSQVSNWVESLDLISGENVPIYTRAGKLIYSPDSD